MNYERGGGGEEAEGLMIDKRRLRFEKADEQTEPKAISFLKGLRGLFQPDLAGITRMRVGAYFGEEV